VGGTVAVIGLGLIGLLAVQVARASGVRVLGIDVDPSACPLASQLGAEQAVARSEAVEEVAASLSEGVGMDAVIVCASTPSADPLALAGSLARDRGRVVVVGAVGMTLPRDRFYEKELELRMSRSYGPGRYDPSYEEHGHDYPPGYVRWTEQRNLAEFLRLIASGDVDVDTLTTHRLRVEQAADAYALVSDGPADGTRPLGVVLAYDGTGPVPRAGDTPPPQRTPGRPRRDTVGIGLVGAGSFATRILIPALADDRRVELVGVATATGVTASHVASRFGFGFASSDPAALIGHEDVDAVVVATRHDSHADLTARALAAGKPVFCEKPLATTTDGLERVAGAARESGAPLLVGFNRRFSPLTASLRTILPTGVPRVIGYRVNAGMPVQGHWTGDPVAGGGRLTGEVCHFLDFACHIAEGPPAEVGGTELGAGGDRNDSVILLVRFACGSVASIQYLANGDRAVPKERIEVFCGGVVATLDDFRRLEIARDGRRRREGGRRPQKGHREEMRAFVDLALGRASDVQSLEAALWSSALTLQAAPALRAGCGVPVDFPGYGPAATAVRDSAE
jgi:predicted dehydrogenase